MLNLILKLPRRVLCVMTVVGIEIVREAAVARYSTHGATVPRELFTGGGLRG